MIIKVIKRNAYRSSAVCICDGCHKEYKTSLVHAQRATRQFCSNKCRFDFFKVGKTAGMYPKKSIVKLGRKNPMFGKKYTPEEKRNIARGVRKHSPKTIKSLKHSADILWSRIIRAPGRCAVCGETSSLNPHHIIGRKNMTLRYDLRNGICLCAGCHVFRRQSAHQDPIWFNDWLLKHRKDDYEYLRIARNKITTRTVNDYIKLVEELREKDPFYDIS